MVAKIRRVVFRHLYLYIYGLACALFVFPVAAANDTAILLVEVEE